MPSMFSGQTVLDEVQLVVTSGQGELDRSAVYLSWKLIFVNRILNELFRVEVNHSLFKESLLVVSVSQRDRGSPFQCTHNVLPYV